MSLHVAASVFRLLSGGGGESATLLDYYLGRV